MPQGRSERYETFINWYLRFNGYFTVPSFVVHAGDDPSRISGEAIGNLTEVDTIAVRLPHSREGSPTPFPIDQELVDEGAKGRFDVILAEVKSANSNSPNKVWRNGETSHIEYLLKFIGWHQQDHAIKKAASDLATKYVYEEPKPSVRVRYIIFAQSPDSTWQKKGVRYFTFNDCIRFLAEERGQCWANSGIGRRSMHGQWNPLIKRVFEIANGSLNSLCRQQYIARILDTGHSKV